QERDAERLVPGRKGEHVGGTVVHAHLSLRPLESHLRADPPVPRSPLQGRTTSTLAYEEQHQPRHVPPGPRDRIDQEILPLLGVQPTHVEDHYVVRPDAAPSASRRAGHLIAPAREP